MSKRVLTRGNTAFFSFTFYDEDGDIAIVASADVQVTYPGADDFVTETIALSSAGTAWAGEWDTSKSRAGWVEFHAHGYAAGGVNYGDDGRFRVSGNRANLDHDALPTNATPSSSAMVRSRSGDYCA
jgi:hypothetical protein